MKIDLLYTHLITGTTTVHVNTLINCKYESFNKYVCFLYTVLICNKVYKAFLERSEIKYDKVRDRGHKIVTKYQKYIIF